MPLSVFVVPAIVLAWLGTYFSLLPPLRAQSLMFPRFVAWSILGIVALLLLLQWLRARKGELVVPPPAVDPKSAWLFYGLCVGYVALFWLLGFVAASTIYLIAAMTVFPVRWPIRIGVTVGTVAALYALFGGLFGIPL
ncbi:MAG: tripartite tricarboxylate transporter TctB family protein [Alphaproteobacteria bacterium]|nr:tripartite tricarboxylate transporter TctB family protein [Alphaproteobacteria bacterium]